MRSAKANAWKAMSEYIRRKYADSDGYVTCVTCGCRKLWNDGMQAGHFVPRARGNAVYFLEENVHPQCYSCNVGRGGRLIEYTKFIIATYGAEKVDELLDASRKTVRYRVSDYLEIESDFRQRISELTAG